MLFLTNSSERWAFGAFSERLGAHNSAVLHPKHTTELLVFRNTYCLQQ
jgi:hypothetical protein